LSERFTHRFSKGKRPLASRVEEERVVYAEPIRIGERIRDITTAGRGEFVLWTDKETVVRLTPARALDRGPRRLR
jgi:hypothetical protein